MFRGPDSGATFGHDVPENQEISLRKSKVEPLSQKHQAIQRLLPRNEGGIKARVMFGQAYDAAFSQRAETLRQQCVGEAAAARWFAITREFLKEVEEARTILWLSVVMPKDREDQQEQIEGGKVSPEKEPVVNHQPIPVERLKVSSEKEPVTRYLHRTFGEGVRRTRLPEDSEAQRRLEKHRREQYPRRNARDLWRGNKELWDTMSSSSAAGTAAQRANDEQANYAPFEVDERSKNEMLDDFEELLRSGGNYRRRPESGGEEDGGEEEDDNSSTSP